MTVAAPKSGSSNVREISLGDDFGDVAVKVNGVRIEVGRDKYHWKTTNILGQTRQLSWEIT
jgi:hypothetical protein